MSTFAGAVARGTTHSILTPSDSTVVNAVKLGGRSIVRIGAVTVAAIEMIALGCLGILVRGLSFCVFGELEKRLTVFSQSMLTQAKSAFSESIASYSVTSNSSPMTKFMPSLAGESSELKKSVQNFIFRHKYAIAVSFVVIIALTAYAMRNPTASLAGPSPTPPSPPPGGTEVSQIEASQSSQSLEGIRWLASQWEAILDPPKNSPLSLFPTISQIFWVNKMAIYVVLLPSVREVVYYAFNHCHRITTNLKTLSGRSKVEVCTEITFAIILTGIKIGNEAVKCISKHKYKIAMGAAVQIGLYPFLSSRTE